MPNEQHLPVAEEVAKAGKHVYTEKPIAHTLEDGMRIEALQQRYGVQVVVGHSARLLAGTRMIKQAIDRGELGRVAFMEANFSNERALELTPSTWRWYKDRAPGGPLSQLAIHQFDALHYLGGEITEVSSMASKLSPVGAEVDDQSMTLMRFADGKVAYVGVVLDLAGHLCDSRVRLERAHALRDRLQHLGHARRAAQDLHALHPARQGRLRQARERSRCPKATCSATSWRCSRRPARPAKPCELTAHNGNVAVAVVNAALRSIERNGQYVRIADVLNEARAKVSDQARQVAWSPA